MSGVWHDNRWYPHTGFVCRNCGHPVFPADLAGQGYEYQCFFCDEDMFGFEVDTEKSFPRVMVARPVDGITINEALEYLLDDTGQPRIFNNQLDAEAYLMAQSIPYDDLAFLYFIVCDGVPDAPENG